MPKTKKELIAKYKQTLPDAGMYRIVNIQTGKFYLGSAMDLKGKKNRLQFAKMTATVATFPMVMAADIKQYGFDAFSFEILEGIKPKPEMNVDDVREELKILEELWREKLEDEEQY